MIWATIRLYLKLLFRDRIFFPAILFAVAVAAFSVAAGFWSIETYRRVIRNFIFMSFHLAGTAIAIYWTTVLPLRSDWELTSHFNRGTWLVSRFCAMILMLTFLAVSMIVVSQGILLANGLFYFSSEDLEKFFRLTMTWWLAAAVAQLCLSAMQASTALFSTAGLVLMAYIGRGSLAAMTPDHPMRGSLMVFVRFWDFRRFADATYPLEHDILYAGAVIVVLVCVAALLFRRVDLA